MRIETNQKLVKRNSKIAQYMFFFSLGVLIIGFFVTNQQLFGVEPSSEEEVALSLLIPSVVLPIGLVTTLVSVRMTNLWVRQPRPEKAIEEGLKGLSNKSVLYNYYHFPARHVLICPQGVFAIVTRFQDGKHKVQGDKWRTHRTAMGRFLSLFRLDSIGSPTRDALEAAQYIKQKIEPIVPGVEVQPLVVFVDTRVNLEIVDPVVPVLHADTKMKPNLKDFLREIKSADDDEPAGKKGQRKKKEAGMPLTPEEIGAFEAATLPR